MQVEYILLQKKSLISSVTAIRLARTSSSSVYHNGINERNVTSGLLVIKGGHLENTCHVII